MDFVSYIALGMNLLEQWINAHKIKIFQDFEKIFYGCFDLSLIYQHAKICDFSTKAKLTVALKRYPILASLNTVQSITVY